MSESKPEPKHGEVRCERCGVIYPLKALHGCKASKPIKKEKAQPE